MKLLLLIFLISLSPIKGQAWQNELKSGKTDSLFLSDSRNQTYTDSLRSVIPKKQSDMGGYLYKVVLVTFVLIVLLIAGLFLYKKFILKNDTPYSSKIKIIARQNLSAKQSIVVVNIEGKKFALGVTDQQVNLITEMGDVSENDIITSENKPIGFGQIFKNLTTKK